MLLQKKNKNIVLFLFSLATVFFVVEIVLHSLVEPSKNSFGRLFNIELPPKRIFPSDLKSLNQDEKDIKLNTWHKSLVVNDKKITRSDLWGITREDPLMGYAPLENAISTNGWWQTNSSGARSRNDFSSIKNNNITRILFFGDSFTQGSRVPQEETFQNILDDQTITIEPINFGVDGYSLGQSYLRFIQLKEELEFDQVFLSFTPSVNLWREVNISRHIARNWGFYTILPRFVIRNQELSLVPSPYQSLDELIQKNRDSIHPSLRNHLQQYDRFFFSSGYESNAVLDLSIMFKLYKKQKYKKDKALFFKSQMNPKSESVEISKLIAKSMSDEVHKLGGEFSLLVLPGVPNIRQFSRDSNFRKNWGAVVTEVCSGSVKCLNLMPVFQSIGFKNLDKGYDGSHYGPVTNSHVAQELNKYSSILDSGE